MRKAFHIFVLFSLLTGCEQIPQRNTLPEPQPQKTKSPEQFSEGNLKARIGELLKQFESEKYKERQKAQTALLKLLQSHQGDFVLDYLHNVYRTLRDPEQKTRVEQILKPYNQWKITPSVAMAIPGLVQRLESLNPQNYVELARDLGKKRLQDSVELLVSFLKYECPIEFQDYEETDPALDVRCAAADALGKIGSKKAVEPLIATLKHGNRKVRRVTLEALGEISGEKAQKTLRQAWLQDKDSVCQISAAYGICNLTEDGDALDFLLNALKDENVSEHAVFILGKLGSKEAVDPLLELMKTETEPQRWLIIWTLGKIGDAKAVDTLVKFLGKEYEDTTSIFAMHALAEIGCKKAIGHLVEALNDEYEHIKNEAAQALRKMTGQDFGTDYEKWKSWYEKNKGK